jgi:hypothetical protein
MSDATALIVGSGVTLAGVGIGTVSSWLLSRRERRLAQRDELRRALGAYLGALYEAVAFLRQMPDVPDGGWLTGLGTLGERISWVSAQRHLAMLGSRPLQAQERVVAALAQLQVLKLPPELQRAVEASAQFVERLAGSRAPEVVDRWPEVYADLHAATEGLGG